MGTIRRSVLTLPGSRLPQESAYPVLCEPLFVEKEQLLSEDEGLFVNYGRVSHVLPYAELGGYTRADRKVALETFVLENERLCATFVPALGGRLWSLVDKRDGRDLIVANTAMQPCNFAVRDAWVSGGIEWNCGIRGHHALTYEQIFATPYTMRDGNQALRIYAFERIRAVTYQMDFFLRDDLPFLFARMRIVNASHRVTPIYWWSTTAVKQELGARVIVPADAAYVNQGSRPMYLTDIPFVKGKDLSYPTNHTESVDHFYKIPQEAYRYEAYVFADGAGLMQASTRRLSGRKLFVWGMSQGGENWQRFLTNEAGFAQPYVEIQAGLAATQNESLPMPPDTAWEWLEAYGPVELPREQAHGNWALAQEAAAEWLHAHLPESTLDALLAETKGDALLPVSAAVCGSGWGALENALRDCEGRRRISPHLDFGQAGAAQQPWLRFLETGKLIPPNADAFGCDCVVQDEWFRRIKAAVRGADVENPYCLYQLGLCYYARALYEEAAEAFSASLGLKESSHAHYGLGNALRMLQKPAEAAAELHRALALDPASVMLAREALRFAYDTGDFVRMADELRLLPEEVRTAPMIRALTAVVYAHSGRNEEARSMMRAPDIVPPDLREGDNFLPTEYVYNELELARQRGETLEAANVAIPASIDYRMFA